MSEPQVKPVNQSDLQDLKNRMKLIADADPAQYHNEFSLKRYLRAFKSTDEAFKAILKTNKWRKEYGVEGLSVDSPEVKKHLAANKARVLKYRDMFGRPIIYIPAKCHNASDRDIDELTKFIVYCLLWTYEEVCWRMSVSFSPYMWMWLPKTITTFQEDACKRCFEEVIDNLCIVFDLKDFGIGCMDYQLIKNLIWLLSKHYPERLGVCLIINSSPLFSSCWLVIKGWLDENTTSKVTFVNSEEELCKYLIPDVLPTDI